MLCFKIGWYLLWVVFSFFSEGTLKSEGSLWNGDFGILTGSQPRTELSGRFDFITSMVLASVVALRTPETTERVGCFDGSHNFFIFFGARRCRAEFT